MTNSYDNCIKQWDEIFLEGTKATEHTLRKSTGNDGFDKGLKWVCKGTEKILDFGCGNGSLLFMCSFNGTKTHVGIDLSENAIKTAQNRQKQMPHGHFEFVRGSIEVLDEMDEASFDAVILSNIVDNLYPEDAAYLMSSVNRILKKDGKIFIKLNPYLTQEQISEWNIKVIKDNLLDDGFVLWNNTTDQWKTFSVNTLNSPMMKIFIFQNMSNITE